MKIGGAVVGGLLMMGVMGGPTTAQRNAIHQALCIQLGGTWTISGDPNSVLGVCL